MSGGPSPPGVGPQLRAAWGRVEALLGETHLPETFKWEALRRVRNFYGELQDLVEGVGQAPAEWDFRPYSLRRGGGQPICFQTKAILIAFWLLVVGNPPRLQESIWTRD